MGLLGSMVAGGIAGGAGFMADDIQKQIAMERQQALEEARAMRAEEATIRAEGRKREDPLYKEQLRGSALENDSRGQTIEKNSVAMARDAKYGDKLAALEISTAELKNAAAKQSLADVGKDEKKRGELSNAYETYAHYLRSNAQQPGKFDGQLASEASRIMSLGGDPAKMTDLLMGTREKIKVAEEATDPTNPDKKVTTTRDKVTERTGGLIVQPAQGQGPTREQIIATAKARGYNDKQIADRLKQAGL